MDRFVDIDWQGRRVRIECRSIDAADTRRPAIVFLHEGLGSVAMWRDFPAALCAAAGCRGIVYSRPGYGRSTPRVAGEHWTPDFMHRQARELLPALRIALGIAEQPVVLFGHSDGGSIALLHAAFAPDTVAGAIVVAPHIVVEPVSITSIEAARTAYLHGDLRERLARHHADVDSAFFGWNDAWLSPAFRGWTIEAELAAIRCPLLAVQGSDDAYGTLEQIRGIARRVPRAELLELPGGGHTPQRDRPAAVIDAAVRFLARLKP